MVTPPRHADNRISRLLALREGETWMSASASEFLGGLLVLVRDMSDEDRERELAAYMAQMRPSVLGCSRLAQDVYEYLGKISSGWSRPCYPRTQTICLGILKARNTDGQSDLKVSTAFERRVLRAIAELEANAIIIMVGESGYATHGRSWLSTAHLARGNQIEGRRCGSRSDLQHMSLYDAVSRLMEQAGASIEVNVSQDGCEAAQAATEHSEAQAMVHVDHIDASPIEDVRPISVDIPEEPTSSPNEAPNAEPVQEMPVQEMPTQEISEEQIAYEAVLTACEAAGVDVMDWHGNMLDEQTLLDRLSRASARTPTDTKKVAAYTKRPMLSRFSPGYKVHTQRGWDVGVIGAPYMYEDEAA